MLDRKVLRITQDHDDALIELEREHQRRKASLPVNEAGEVSASDLLELAMWREQTENEIRQAFIKAIMEEA